MTMRCVRFFVQEGMHKDGRLIHEWMFDQARSLGIQGGSVFRASAGYGRHGLHEDTFFELAGTLPESVEFFGEEEKIQALIGRVGEAGLKLVYVTHPVEVGTTG
jgi:PII-like signaling protein